MDVTHTKVRRQRRRGVYRLPISAAASAKWQRDGQTGKSQPRGRRAKRGPAALQEQRAGLLDAVASERPQGLTTGWDGDGLCEDAFKQFVHECEQDINASNGDSLSLQRTTPQSEVDSSKGCESNELGRESDAEGNSQETEDDSTLGFTDVRLNECEELLKTPQANLTDLSYDLHLSSSEFNASIEPEQNGESILANFGSEEQRSDAEHTTSSDNSLGDDKICPMLLSQIYPDEPQQSRERDDVNTELIGEEEGGTLNVAQLFESCSPDFVQESSLGTAEDCKDVITRHTLEEDPWGESVTLDQKCNLVNVIGEQRNSISEVNSAVENLLDQFSPTRIKVEDSEPIFQGLQNTEEYVLLEEDEGEVVLTLAVGDGGQLVPTAGGRLHLPPELAAQIAACSCTSAATDAAASTPRGDGGCVQEQEASLLLSDADLVLAGEAIQEALNGMGSPPPAQQQQKRREERLHFGDVEEALDAIENGGTPRRQRPRQTHRLTQHQHQHRAPPRSAALPVKMQGTGVHKEVERAAKALFSKRTRTLYHWMYPDTPKRKLKATVASAWDTLPESEKLIYMSQVMGRFGTPASNLMVNPQLVGMSADQLETECAVAGLLAAEAEAEAEVSSGEPDPYRPARKRAPLASLPPFHGKRSRAAQQPIFNDTELDPCKQDTDDEISTAELFAPLGI